MNHSPHHENRRHSVAVWLATGLGIGLVPFAPGTFGTLLGLPLAWAIGELPSLGWQVGAIAFLTLGGVPLCTKAGDDLGGGKDHPSIVWDEIASLPIVFLFVPMTGPTIALAGFALHRLFDITKPPPARQAERLPDGLGVMADDTIAAIYAGLALAGLRWMVHNISAL